MKEKTFVDDIDRSVYDVKNKEEDVYKVGEGLTPEIVEQISREKKDPLWMQTFRLQSLQIYHSMKVPDWGPSIDGLDMDHIVTYVRPNTHMSAKWSDVPKDIKKTFELLGIPQAEPAWNERKPSSHCGRCLSGQRLRHFPGFCGYHAGSCHRKDKGGGAQACGPVSAHDQEGGRPGGDGGTGRSFRFRGYCLHAGQSQMCSAGLAHYAGNAFMALLMNADAPLPYLFTAALLELGVKKASRKVISYAAEQRF